ncbi:hypothetical protein ACFVWY_08695 [Streptomyces sp. NPDC058195]|uniref:hypothetical protein n=1 Tax=Streptomyces sp. NPDC058195 TaxID=3346375 RepID=UPI0036E2BD0F
MNTDLTLQRQGSPILLLAHLHATMQRLPAASFHVTPVYPTVLEISLHDSLDAFTAWREALGLNLSELDARSHKGSSWVTVDGVVDDVLVRLTGYGDEVEVAAYQAMSAVAA